MFSEEEKSLLTLAVLFCVLYPLGLHMISYPSEDTPVKILLLLWPFVAFPGYFLLQVHMFRPGGTSNSNFTGGAYTGYIFGIKYWPLNIGWPFAKLFIGEKGLILVLPWRRYALDKAEVSYRMMDFSVVRPSSGVQILHSKNEYPKLIAFDAYLSIGALRKILETNGYKFEIEVPTKK